MRLLLQVDLVASALLFATGAMASVVYFVQPSNWSSSLAIVPPGAAVSLLAILLMVSTVCAGAGVTTAERPGSSVAVALLMAVPLVTLIPYLVLLANSSIVFVGHSWPGEARHAAVEVAARCAVTGLVISGLALVLSIVTAVAARS
jgi:hypothetical protein